MIGPSVYLVRLLGTMVLRNVGTAIAVLAGCFNYADQVFNLVRVPCALLSVEHLFHSGDGVYSWTGPSMPHMTCQEPFCCRWAISTYRSSLRPESPSVEPCEFDRAADKCKISSDEDFFRLHLHVKTASPDHLSIVFPALLPGLNWVTRIDVHVAQLCDIFRWLTARMDRVPFSPLE
jgi:hypothetical protein